MQLSFFFDVNLQESLIEEFKELVQRYPQRYAWQRYASEVQSLMPEFYLQDAYNTLTQYMENPFSTDQLHFQNMAIRITEIADKLTSEEIKKLHALGERNSSRKTHYKELVQPIFRDLLQLKTD